MTGTTISGNSSTWGGGIYLAEGTLTATGLTLSGNSVSFDGGGIAAYGALDLAQCTVSGNTAIGNGGGLGAWEPATIDDSTISDNSADGLGGGIYADDDVTLTNTTINGNSALAGGGLSLWEGTGALDNTTITGNSSAAYIAESYLGTGGGILSWNSTLAMTNTTINDNSASSNGAGVLNSDGAMTLTNCLVTGNSSEFNGGGINNQGAGVLTVIDSTVAQNVCRSRGAGIANWDQGTVTVTGCSVSNNSANHLPAFESMGGAIFNAGGLVDVGSSSISDNWADAGGGIFTMKDLTAANSTISGNSANRGGAAHARWGNATLTLTNVTVAWNHTNSGGALDTRDGGEITLKNTIVANQPDDADCSGNVVTYGYNIDTDDTCNLTDLYDQPGTDPKIGPLQDNGGSTLTHALLEASPAIDAGDNSVGLTNDQRGLPRPVAGKSGCVRITDIGAYEDQGFVDLFVTKSGPANPVMAGEELIYDLTVQNLGDQPATGVVLSDTLAAQLEYLSDTDNCAVVGTSPSDGQILECQIGDLQGCVSIPFQIRTRVRPDAMAGEPTEEISIGNSAGVSGDQDDHNIINNLALVVTLVQGQADLRVTKTMEPQGTIWGGHPFTYTILIENDGPSVAENVQFSENLTSVGPAFGSMISAPNYTCTPSVGDPVSGTQLHWDCTRDGLMYPQEQDEITVVVTVEGGGTVVNSVAVSTDTLDPNPTNNLAMSMLQVVEEADLEVVKFSDPEETQSPHVPFTYTVQLSNPGPSGARNVVILDTLQSDFTTTASIVSAPGYACDPGVGVPLSGQQLQWTCTRDEYMYFDVQDEITIVATGEGSGAVNNLVEVTAASPDPQVSNNRAGDSISVIDLADLQVVKMSKPDDTVLAGESFSWYVFVQNNGPSPARNVRLTDNMLSDGQFSVIDVTHGPEYDCTLSPSSGGYDLDCSRSTPLPSGAQDELIIEVVSSETCDINNQAWVTTGTPDPDTSNNYAHDSIHVGDTADLSLTKTAAGEVQVSGQQGSTFNLTLPGVPFPESPNYSASATEVTAGRRIQYTLSVDNTGPSTAQNVQVTDRLPAGVTLYPGSLSVSQGSCETGTPGVPLDQMVCGLGALDSGQSATITFQVLVDHAIPEQTVLENDASVSSDVLDLDNSNNHVHTLTAVNNWADLLVSSYSAWGEIAVLLEDAAIVYQEYPDQVTAGRQLRYEITVENRGPGQASDVTVQHWVDYAANPMMTFLRADGASCSPDEVNWGLMHCQLGTLAAGATETINLYFSVFPGVPPSVPLLHSQVDVSSSQTGDPFFDPQLQNDTWVIPVADLSIRKGTDAWKVYAGEEIQYDISVTNRGPSWACHVTTVTDTFPEWVEFEVATMAPEQCVDQGSDLVCTWRWWDPIPNGETRTFSVFTRVRPDTPPGTIISNEALVASTQSWDPLAYNDRDTAASLIGGKADLKIQKFGKPDGQVYAGEELTYTVIVDNLGPGYAHDVLLTDLLESSGTFELISLTSNRDADCSPTSGGFTKELQLTCGLTDTLEVATTQPGSGRWMLTVVVQAAEAQDINNVAKVASSDYDLDLSNNEAIAEHEITAVADLALTKIAQGEMLVGCEGETELWQNEVAAGAAMTYTLTVTNTGPSTAKNVVLTDQPLPSLLELTEVIPSKGTCDTTLIGAPDYALECWLGTLLPGQTETVLITADVPSWVPEATSFSNVARVYSDMFDDDNSSNMGANETAVTTAADLEVLKTQDPDIALPGWDITYSITVTNLGPSDAEGVFISDTIPVQLLDPTWTCCASDDGECNVPSEPPVCPEGPCEWPDPGLFAQAHIPAGEWVIYTVTGTLDWWPCGPFTNTVEVIAPPSMVHEGEDIDPCDQNNTNVAVNDPMCHFEPLVLKDFPGADSTN